MEIEKKYSLKTVDIGNGIGNSISNNIINNDDIKYLVLLGDKINEYGKRKIYDEYVFIFWFLIMFNDKYDEDNKSGYLKDSNNYILFASFIAFLSYCAI